MSIFAQKSKRQLMTINQVRREMAYQIGNLRRSAGIEYYFDEEEAASIVNGMYFSENELAGSLDDLTKNRLFKIAWDVVLPEIDPCVLMYWAS